MLSDIKCLYLLTGQIIIGQVMSYDSVLGLYSVKNPVTLDVRPTPKGTEVAMLPWPPIATESLKTVEVNRENLLLAPYEPVEQIKNGYNEKFGSGLVLPNKGKLEF